MQFGVTVAKRAHLPQCTAFMKHTRQSAEFNSPQRPPPGPLYHLINLPHRPHRLKQRRHDKAVMPQVIKSSARAPCGL